MVGFHIFLILVAVVVRFEVLISFRARWWSVLKFGCFNGRDGGWF